MPTHNFFHKITGEFGCNVFNSFGSIMSKRQRSFAAKMGEIFLNLVVILILPAIILVISCVYGIGYYFYYIYQIIF